MKFYIFSAFLICGFALSFSFVEYAYPDSNTDKILYEMCIQKQEYGIVENCDGIYHTITDNNELTIYNVDSSDIGVILSNTCLTMIKNNVTSNCPTYYDIQLLNLNIIFDPNVIVDPNIDIISHIRLITLVTNLDNYKIQPNSTNTNYDHLTDSFDYSMGKSRYIDESCSQATITVQDSLFLLNDTINYMINDCDEEFTNADTIKTWSKNATAINYSDYTYYKYKSWLDDTINNCTKQYGICK